MAIYSKDIYCVNPEGICERYTVNEDQYCSDLGFDTVECSEGDAPRTTTTTTAFPLNLPCVSAEGGLLVGNQTCCEGLFPVDSAVLSGLRICVRDPSVPGAGFTPTGPSTTTTTTTAAPTITTTTTTLPPVTSATLANLFVWQFQGLNDGELPDAVVYRRFTTDRIPTYRVTLKNLSDALHIYAAVANDTSPYIRIVDPTQNVDITTGNPRPQIQLEPLQSREVIVSFDASINVTGTTSPKLVFNLEGFRFQ